MLQYSERVSESARIIDKDEGEEEEEKEENRIGNNV